MTTEYEIDDSGIRIRQLGQEMKADWSTVVCLSMHDRSDKLVLDPPGIIAIPHSGIYDRKTEARLD